MCGKEQIPKVSFEMWLMCKGRIITKDRLRSCGMDNLKSDCEIYSTGEETVQHLFFECDLTKVVWQKVRCKCLIYRRTYSWQEELNWMVAHCRTNSFADKIKRLAFSITIY